MTAMDAALEYVAEPGGLEAVTAEPFGHYVPADKRWGFCLVSEARGILGYFDELRMAQPFCRMLIRNAWAGHGRLDFRLYGWLEEAQGWEIALRALPLEEMGKERAA